MNVFDIEQIFKQFQLDPEYGFVSCTERAQRKLPPQYDIWETLAADLHALATSGALRGIVDNVEYLSSRVNK